MKKTLALVLCIVLFAIMTIPTLAAPPTKEGEATGISAAPKIDGVIDDVWAQATEYTVGNLKDGADTGIKATFKVLWDSNNVYVLVTVPDTTPFYEHNDAYQKDGAELFFDFQNLKTDTYDEDHQFRMTVFRDGSGVAFEVQASTWDAGLITSAIADSAGSYIAEVAVNAGGAGFTLTNDMIIGMDAQINDNAEDTGRTACYGWNDDSNNVWQYPTHMGNIKLLAGAAAPAADTTPAPTPAEPSPAPAPAEPTPAPAPVAPSPAPQTADPITLIALGSIISAAGVVIAKKRK